ncbi:hypothetical protein [Aeromonas media]|uniref:hypothetical protein n=1 Tax=Aeromonas media TaxID=651 RepID=UPI00223FE2D8|nr:hypothetical protein [Aeromonas media]
MREITMKPVSTCLLILLSLPALAGQVIVNQGMSTADTFALRDQLAREHEWQEWLRFQQAVKWLEVLPVNCDLVGGAGREYRCGDNYYRPYRQNGRDLYIQGDPPGQSPQRPIKKAP